MESAQGTSFLIGRIAMALLAMASPAASVGSLARALRGEEFVIVSQPERGRVVYIQLNLFHKGVSEETKPLITDGLQKPFGLAIDHNTQRLFVADPLSEKVFMYKLQWQNGILHTDGKQYVAVSGVAPRWVAVDEHGNVFVTDENSNQIAKVSKENLDQASTSPVTLYTESSTPQVSTPGGIVCDGSHIFWGNKADGGTKGSIIKALEVPDPEDSQNSPKALAANAPRVYGVCASQNNVFYSGDGEFLYGVKKNAQGPGEAKAVSNILVKPRGCAWDGDGTIYVADRGGNKIYSFPSAMHTITDAEISVVQSGIDDPFGVAVYRPPTVTEQDKVEQFLGVGAAYFASHRGKDIIEEGADKASEMGGVWEARAVWALALPLLVSFLL